MFQFAPQAGERSFFLHQRAAPHGRWPPWPTTDYHLLRSQKLAGGHRMVSGTPFSTLISLQSSSRYLLWQAQRILAYRRPNMRTFVASYRLHYRKFINPSSRCRSPNPKPFQIQYQSSNTAHTISKNRYPSETFSVSPGRCSSRRQVTVLSIPFQPL